MLLDFAFHCTSCDNSLAFLLLLCIFECISACVRQSVHTLVNDLHSISTQHKVGPASCWTGPPSDLWYALIFIWGCGKAQWTVRLSLMLLKNMHRSCWDLYILNIFWNTLPWTDWADTIWLLHHLWPPLWFGLNILSGLFW